MINRNKTSNSYEENKINTENNSISNVSKNNNINTITSPDILLDIDDNNNEIRTNSLEKNINEMSEILYETNKIKSLDYSQNDTYFKSPEKKELKTYVPKRNNNNYVSPRRNQNSKNEIELFNKNNIECNEKKNNDYIENNNRDANIEKERKYYINKCNDLINNEFENENEKVLKQNKDKINNDIKNFSLMNFRHSNNFKTKKTKEDIKRTYYSKRFYKNLNYNSKIDSKEIKICKNRNGNKINIDNKKDINLFLTTKKKNNELLNRNDESSQSYLKMERNYQEENESEIKKVHITEYRIKMGNKPTKLELKNEVISGINNNMKNKLLKTDKLKNGNNNKLIYKKADINITLESNNGDKEEKKITYNNSYGNRNYSMDKYKNLNIIKIRPNIKDYLINKENNRKNSRENSINNENSDSSQNPDHWKNKYYNSNTLPNKNKKYNTLFTVYNNNVETEKNIDNNYDQQSINMKKAYINNIKGYGITNFIKNTIKIKPNNLIEYKYKYYINKRNKKFKKIQNGNNTTTIDEIKNLYNDFLKIKNSKKKRFHSNINQHKKEMYDFYNI